MSGTEANWTIELRFESSDVVLKLNLFDELLVGRTEKHDSAMQGFDLASLNGEEMGVSRRHALLRDEGDYISVTDLNSSNGTFVNGVRIPSNSSQRLNDGDRIHFGHLISTISIVDTIGRTSIRASKVDFNLRNAPKIGHGQRILLIEDDPRTTELYQLSLKRAGYNILSAREVVAAIRLMNAQAPAVVLLDLLLPSLHGLEFTRYVRRDTKYPTLPIIILSALSDPASVQQAMDAGADVYVSKPPNFKELIRLIGAFVQKHEAERAAGQGTRKLENPAQVLEDVRAKVTAPTANTIVMFMEGDNDPLSVVVSSQIVLGRGGGMTNKVIDLDPYGAYDKGVSRMHAAIRHNGDGKFSLEDLGSSNGTYINVRQLHKNETVPLEHGDEIRLGEFRLIVYMLNMQELRGTGNKTES